MMQGADPMTRAPAWLALLVLVVIGLPGCTSVYCTAKGCFDGVEVTFDQRSPLAAGDYQLDVVLDDERVSCDFSLPQGTREDLCRTDEILWGVTPDGSFHRAFIKRSPQVLEITLSGDGVSASETFRPSYEEHRPNGPRCSPTCQVAAVTFRVG